jgi:hypothetical protein
MNLTDILSQLLNPQQGTNRLAMLNDRGGDAGNYLSQPFATQQMPQALSQALLPTPQDAGYFPPAPAYPTGDGNAAAYTGPITKGGGYPEETLIPARTSNQPPRVPQTDETSGVGGFLGNLFQPSQTRLRNQTISWLRGEGLDDGTAQALASNRPLLQKFLVDRMEQNTPKSAMEMQKLGLEVDKLRNPRMDPGEEARLGLDRQKFDFERTNADKTNDIKEYQQAKREGYGGDFRQWQIDMRQAGAQNITVGSEKGYDKTIGEGYGKRFLDIQEGSQTAQRALNALDVMQGAMADPGFYSGAGAEKIKGLKRLGSAIGIANAEGIDSIETFNAMAKQAALDTMGGSLGSGFSNADRDFVLDQVPSLANTPGGNQRLITVQRALNTRKQDVARLAREYATQNGGRIDVGFDDYLAKWSEQNPLFPNTPPDSTGRGAGSETGRQRARNPKTGETVEWDGTQWRPVR